MTRAFAASLLVVLVSAVTAACASDSGGSDSGSTGSTQGDGPPAVCSSIEELRASVDDLTTTDVSAEGTAALQEKLDAVEGDVLNVIDDAQAEYAAQADQLERDFDELQLVADTARTSPSASNLSAVRTAIGTLADDVRALADDVTSTC